MNEEMARVKCRPRRFLWIGVIELCVLSFALIILPFVPDKDGHVNIHRNQMAVYYWVAVTTLLSSIPVAYLSLYLLRARIIADTDGLRWRGIGKERFARWIEIIDFYDPKYAESSTRKSGRIETAVGKVFLTNFNNQGALRAYIQSHATNAASHEWTSRSLEAITKWPQTFAYKRAENVIMPLDGLFLFCLPIVIYLSGGFKSNTSNGFVQSTRDIWSFGGPFAAIAFVLLLLSMVALWFFATPLLPIRFWMNIRPRWKQRIVATPDDIAFFDDEETIRATWSDVIRVTKQRDKFFVRTYEVETRNGNFNFTNDIYASSRLLQLFQEYSQGAIQQLDEEIEKERLGILGEVRVENGKCIHGFVSQQNRMMLWMLWSFASIPFLLRAINIPTETPHLHISTLIAFGVMSVLISSWLTCLYKHDYISTDENGISHRTPFRTKFIAWNDVERFGKSDLDFYIVESSGERIRFWGEIAQQKQLLETIAQSSTRSRTREWHHI